MFFPVPLYLKSHGCNRLDGFIFVHKSGWCPGPDLNRYDLNGREILSLLCLPFHHPGVGRLSGACALLCLLAAVFGLRPKILKMPAREGLSVLRTDCGALRYFIKYQ